MLRCCSKSTLNNLFSFLSKYFQKRKSVKLITKKKLADLELLIDANVTNPQIFIEAFTHRSAIDHNRFKVSNERLEFLGDAVLGFIIGEALFVAFPSKDEGYLTKIRANFVNKAALYDCAQRISMHQFLFVGAELNTGAHNGYKTILADSVEALIGAIYIDCGMEKAKRFIRKYLVEPNLKLGLHLVDENYKSQLLEFTQAVRIDNPKYAVVKETGPEHDREFTVQISIGEKVWGEGKGKNKKSAEQEAARNAIKTIPPEQQKHLHKVHED